MKTYKENASIVSENAFIGSLLIDNSVLDDVNYLKPEDFGSFLHSEIYRAICNLINDGKSADIISVSEYLAPNDNILFVDVCNIANSSFIPLNIKHYAEIVKQSSLDRKMITIAQEIISNVHNKKENRLDLAQRRMAEIEDSSHCDTIPAVDIFNTVMHRIDDRQNNPSDIIGLPTGFRDLDSITHGLHPGHLIILAARPSMGKTLLGMNIAEHVAINEKKPVIIFSLEMNKEELVERSLSSLGKVDQDLIKTGKLTKSDWEQVSSLVPRYSDAKLFIEDYSGVRISDIRAKCRQIKRKHGLSLVVIDYLTLVSGDGENETDRVGKISRAFKLLARDLNVPVLLISQLNRGVEQRQEKRPTMADLRQSGAIEQDADLIAFIYRDEVYNKNSKHLGIAEVNIAKNRHGSLGTIYLKFNGMHCRFDNHSDVIVPICEKKMNNHYYDN